MRLKKILACCSLMAVALSASASVELTFEDRGVVTGAVGNPYAGITFSGSPFTRGSTLAGGTGNFVGQVDASHLTNNVAMFVNDPAIGTGFSSSLTINVAAGFSTLFQMLYTTYDSWPGTNVQIFSEADGKGTLLGSTGPFPLVDQTGCTAPLACNWGLLDIDLDDNVAHSVVITSPDNVFYFDNIVFGDLPSGTTDPGTVPEPTGAALALTALGALAFTRRRRS